MRSTLSTKVSRRYHKFIRRDYVWYAMKRVNPEIKRPRLYIMIRRKLILNKNCARIDLHRYRKYARMEHA